MKYCFYLTPLDIIAPLEKEKKKKIVRNVNQDTVFWSILGFFPQLIRRVGRHDVWWCRGFMENGDKNFTLKLYYSSCSGIKGTNMSSMRNIIYLLFRFFFKVRDSFRHQRRYKFINDAEIKQNDNQKQNKLMNKSYMHEKWVKVKLLITI